MSKFCFVPQFPTLLVLRYCLTVQLDILVPCCGSGRYNPVFIFNGLALF